MNIRQIKKHAIKYFERIARSQGISHYREYLDDELQECFGDYALRLLEKNSLLGEETKLSLYRIAGEYALGDRRYSDAKRYLSLAGRKDLLKKIESEREKWLRVHQRAEEIASDPNHYKNN